MLFFVLISTFGIDEFLTSSHTSSQRNIIQRTTIEEEFDEDYKKLKVLKRETCFCCDGNI